MTGQHNPKELPPLTMRVTVAFLDNIVFGIVCIVRGSCILATPQIVSFYRHLLAPHEMGVSLAKEDKTLVRQEIATESTLAAVHFCKRSRTD